MAIKPIKPSKSARNNRKQETKKLLAEQLRQQSAPPRRLEDVAYKRLD